MSSDKLPQRRIFFYLTFLVVLFLVLTTRLGYLQIVRGAELKEWSEKNRIRIVSIVAPRGVIYDRHGRVLAGNRPAFTISLFHLGGAETDQAIDELVQVLGISREKIEEMIDRHKRMVGLYKPVKIKTDITPETHTAIAERRPQLPGVVIESEPVRYYPHGKLAAHVLGYVGEETPTQIVGRAGLELAFDVYQDGRGLSGINGGKQVEVDARGRRLRDLGEEPPVAGNSLVLTIDADLQRAAENAMDKVMEQLRKGIDPVYHTKIEPLEQVGRGAVVVLDVNSGQILAMVSRPAYDPNSFAVSITRKEYQELEEAGALVNWAVQAAVPPASTFKPVTAIAALEEGRTYPGERFNTYGGVYTKVPGTSPQCWYRKYGGHGVIDLQQAISYSCDIVFYELGNRLGIDLLEKYARLFGFGQPTGFRDLLEREATGIVASREAKKVFYPDDPRWYAGETLSAAIGQGLHSYSPLQMATYTAVLASGGLRYRPYLVKKIMDPNGKVIEEFKPQVLDDISDLISERTWKIVREAMKDVVQPGGTAAGVFRDFPIEVAGKTGTVEWDHPGVDDDAWFIAFAPFEEPQIAIAVYLQGGGSGSTAAAPVARKILEEYFHLNTQSRPAGTQAGKFISFPRD